MNRDLIATIGSLVLLAACASPAESPLEGWTIPLAATSAAGGLAHVTLLAAGNATRFEVFFTAAGPQPTIPLHVYTYLHEGSCAQLPSKPPFDLNDRVLVRTADGDIAQSRRGPFSLRSSAIISIRTLTAASLHWDQGTRGPDDRLGSAGQQSTIALEFVAFGQRRRDF